MTDAIRAGTPRREASASHVSACATYPGADVGQGVAAVGECVQHDLGGLLAHGQLDARLEVAEAGVHAAGGHQPDQVKRSATLPRRRACRAQCLVAEELARTRSRRRCGQGPASRPRPRRGSGGRPRSSPSARAAARPTARTRPAACAGTSATARRTPACRPARPRCRGRPGRAPSRRGSRARRRAAAGPRRPPDGAPLTAWQPPRSRGSGPGQAGSPDQGAVDVREAISSGAFAASTLPP